MDLCEIRARLENLADERLREFSSRLITKPVLLGVPTASLRKFARTLALEPACIRAYEPFYHEEFMLKSFCIQNVKYDADKFELARDFVHTMPNWAVCDSFDGLKFKGESLTKRLLDQCLGSNLEFEKRFFYVYFMRNLCGFSLDEFFEICVRESDGRYYVRMGMAWAIAEMFLKFSAQTTEFLAAKRLDKFTQNKAIQKIRESRRVEQCVKDELAKYKI